MVQFTCTLECGHEIERGHESERPTADWPYAGRMAYCSECRSDQEIVSVDPEQVEIMTETLSEGSPYLTDAGPYGLAWQASDEGSVFYDTCAGTYGYCLHGVGSAGDYYESDDVVGFASAQEAMDAARLMYVESPREDYSEYSDEGDLGGCAT